MDGATAKNISDKVKSQDKNADLSSKDKSNAKTETKKTEAVSGGQDAKAQVPPENPNLLGQKIDFKNLIALGQNWNAYVTQWLQLFSDGSSVVPLILKKQFENNKDLLSDPLNLSEPFLKSFEKSIKDPRKRIEQRIWLTIKYGELAYYAVQKLWGKDVQPVVTPKAGDNRFKHASWSENLYFDILKQVYLLWSESTFKFYDSLNLDEMTTLRVKFYIRQIVNLFSPSNFPFSNPEVILKVKETKGENLIQGFKNLIEDIKRGQGSLRMKQVDDSVYVLGENIALTPGKVIYQNELMQLIQYSPSTEKVFKTPILCTPAWINKYYILDMQQKNSFVKYAVDQGYTVFMISWVNPDERLAHKTFENYLLEGPVTAVRVIEDVTGSKKVNMVGYCLGGTLSSAAAAYLAAKGEDRVNSITLMAAMTDFSDPGEMKVFIDEKQVKTLGKKMDQKGYLDGAEMSAAFNMLRDVDLIWNQWVNNYLLGKKPLAMDLLTWNADSTRMPSEMHKFYLRKMYLENALAKPGGLKFEDVEIDLGKISAPSYQLSCKEDHIAPWKTTYLGTQLFGGPKRFVLSGSGHIAGVINPPVNQKYGYWTNEDITSDSEAWFEKSTQNPGSWWADWSEWLSEYSGPLVEARNPGGEKLVAIEDAPGSYVKKKLA